MRYNSSTDTTLTDAELIHLVRDGDQTAFGQLVDRHSSRIRQLVVLNSRQTRDAEEICQDIWVAVWENIGNLREVNSFGVWLQKIAYTSCRRYYTNKLHAGGEILQEAEQLAEILDQDALARFREMELRSAVIEAVHHLPEKVCSIATLFYLEMWTVNEIAEELDLTVGTVKTRLRDTRARLRKEFGVEEVKQGRTVSVKRQTPKPSRSKIKGDFEMELTFERDNLLHPLQILQGVTKTQPSLPVLSNVLIRAAAGTIEGVATDLETSIRMKVQGTVKTGGAITVSAKKLVDIVKVLPGGKPIDFATTANERVEITCGDGVYEIVGMSDEEFPQLPAVEGETYAISGETLRDVIRKTEFAAAATEDVRHFLSGLYFNCLADNTEVVATDGKRLALAQCEFLNAPNRANGYILPLKAVREIDQTFANSGEVEISVFENQIRFTDGDATLTTRLIDSAYPDYRKILPKNNAGKTVISTEKLLQAVQRITVLSNPKNCAICLEIGTEQIRVSAKTPELGGAHETLPVESGTGTIRIGFDARLLTDALAHIETGFLSMEFSTDYLGELGPVLIKPVGAEDYISLVMPLRLELVPE